MDMVLDFIFYTNLFVMIFISAAYCIMPFLTLPYIQFGIRLPETFSREREMGRLKILYLVSALILSLSFILLYISLYRFIPVMVSIQFPIFQVILVFVVYYFFRSRTRVLKKSATQPDGVSQSVTAYVQKEESKMSILWYIIPWIELSVFILIGVWYYPNIPGTMTTHYNAGGQANGYALRSFVSAFSLLFFVGLPLLAFFDILAIMFLRVRPFQSSSSPRKSVIQMHGFNKLMIKILMSIASSVLLTLFISSAVMWHLLGVQYVFLSVVPVLGVLPVVLFVSIRAGQGGWKLYPGLRESSDGIAIREDDKYWWGGVIYHNKDDSSIFVPKRYGVGYTFNYAHPVAWVILASLLSVPFFILFTIRFW